MRIQLVVENLRVKVVKKERKRSGRDKILLRNFRLEMSLFKFLLNVTFEKKGLLETS